MLTRGELRSGHGHTRPVHHGGGPAETNRRREQQPHPSAVSEDPDRRRVRRLGDRFSPSLPLVLSVPQAASLLGISKDLAYDLAGRGELPSLRFGRRVVVPTKLLLTLLNGEGAPLFQHGSADPAV